MPEGWVWPEPVMAKAADGETDLHTVIFYPPNFSPDQSYPVIDYATNQRGWASAPVGSFINNPILYFGYLLCLSMAALGFVVVSVSGRGTPNRGKKFQDHKFGDPAGTDEGDDHVAAIQELAKTRPYMDLNRVAIAGSMDMMSAPLYHFFKRQDFYKVASSLAYLDIRFHGASFVEQCYGLSPFLPKTSDGGKQSTCKFIEDYIEPFKGKLLLISGGLEMAPESTLRLVDALEKANKDFDMLFLPNGVGNLMGYTSRREWNFLVRNLQHIEPPKNFKLKFFADDVMAELDKDIEATN
jgi:hypothetical protein